jgi:hypothetical protein
MQLKPPADGMVGPVCLAGENGSATGESSLDAFSQGRKLTAGPQACQSDGMELCPADVSKT